MAQWHNRSRCGAAYERLGSCARCGAAAPPADQPTGLQASYPALRMWARYAGTSVCGGPPSPIKSIGLVSVIASSIDSTSQLGGPKLAWMSACEMRTGPRLPPCLSLNTSMMSWPPAEHRGA